MTRSQYNLAVQKNYVGLPPKTEGFEPLHVADRRTEENDTQKSVKEPTFYKSQTSKRSLREGRIIVSSNPNEVLNHVKPAFSLDLKNVHRSAVFNTDR